MINAPAMISAIAAIALASTRIWSRPIVAQDITRLDDASPNLERSVPVWLRIGTVLSRRSRGVTKCWLTQHVHAHVRGAAIGTTRSCFSCVIASGARSSRGNHASYGTLAAATRRAWQVHHLDHG